jgi:hypothetical protein
LTSVFDLHYRLDIRKFRKKIHNPPSEPVGTDLAAADSAGTFSASGSAPQIGGGTFNWSGSGTMVPFTVNAPTVGLILFAATAQAIDSTHLQTFVGAATEAHANDATCTIIVPRAPPQKSDLPVEGPSNFARLPDLWEFNIALDAETADILQGAASTVGTVPYECTDDSLLPKYNFQWGPVPATAGTAPDPESAR